MKFHFKNNLLSGLDGRKAFTLIEVTASLIILALISSGVLVVVNRSMVSVSDSIMRMQAFEVARENMERVLCATQVQPIIEYGESDKYPDIKWEITTETFSVPIDSQTWLRAVCSATYTDSEGKEKTLELTHWLTKLTDEQIKRLFSDENEIIETTDQAAIYAGVNADTILQWVNNGMLLTPEGYYIKGQLDLYKKFDGNPSEEQIAWQYQLDEKLINEGLQSDYEKPDSEDMLDADKTKTDDSQQSDNEEIDLEELLNSGKTIEEIIEIFLKMRNSQK